VQVIFKRFGVTLVSKALLAQVVKTVHAVARLATHVDALPVIDRPERASHCGERKSSMFLRGCPRFEVQIYKGYPRFFLRHLDKYRRTK